jgi:demethylmacrocin O-methyltransferase
MVDDRLQTLAEKYKVDKLYNHSYIPMYQELFKNRTIRRMLEIGIGYEGLMLPFVPEYIHGASLLMWMEFFPEAMIYSCDILPGTLINQGRVCSVKCDQSKPLELLAMIGEFGGNYDVIIDDGSHQKEHQILTAMVLLPFLSSTGMYVIEDVAAANCDEIAGMIGGRVLRGHKRDDDNLIVVWR